MRAQSLLALASLILLMVPVPAVAQGLPALPAPPVGAPSLPAGAPAVPALPAPTLPGAWVGQFRGVPYQVLDGAVSRLDGQKVDPGAARELLNAHRVHELLAAEPGLADRLANRDIGPQLLNGQLAQAQGVHDGLRELLGPLGAADAASLLGSLLGDLPVNPDELLAEVDAAHAKLVEARSALEAVKDRSRDAREALDAFQLTHAVEDKRALLDAFAGSVPVYREAAARLDEAHARIQRAVHQADALVALLEARSDSLLGLIDLGARPQGVDGLVRSLQATAQGLRTEAEALRSDAAFFERAAREPVEDGIPVAWVVGGGAGLAAAGLGSLWWLRRRVGLT